MTEITEAQALVPYPAQRERLNPACQLPYELDADHVYQSMVDFVDFLGFINKQLYDREFPRFENFLMPASFSSLVGEFMNITVPKYCPTLVKNRFHNGHPDLIPPGVFPDDAVQFSHEGIEVKGSRHASGWQGHNPEEVWLMVFHFDSNTANDANKDIGPRRFRFRAVYAARLEKSDWNFSGRSETSRRTITASVNRGGVAKMKANWVYRDSGERES